MANFGVPAPSSLIFRGGLPIAVAEGFRRIALAHYLKTVDSRTANERLEALDASDRQLDDLYDQVHCQARRGICPDK